MADYEDLARFIVEKVASDPSQVTAKTVPRGRTTIVEVGVAQEDMGKVIGKSGRNIDAMRAVVRAAGLRSHERVQLELVEDGDYERPQRYESDDEFDDLEDVNGPEASSELSADAADESASQSEAIAGE